MENSERVWKKQEKREKKQKLCDCRQLKRRGLRWWWLLLLLLLQKFNDISVQLTTMIQSTANLMTADKLTVLVVVLEAPALSLLVMVKCKCKWATQWKTVENRETVVHTHGKWCGRIILSLLRRQFSSVFSTTHNHNNINNNITERGKRNKVRQKWWWCWSIVNW